VLSVEKLVPLHPWLLKSVRWVWWVLKIVFVYYFGLCLKNLLFSSSHLKKLLNILPREHSTGRAWKSLSSWLFRTVKQLFLSFLRHLPWWSRLSRSPLVIARSRRTVYNNYNFVPGRCFLTKFILFQSSTMATLLLTKL
jgi:hypothetical protein